MHAVEWQTNLLPDVWFPSSTLRPIQLVYRLYFFVSVKLEDVLIPP